MVSKSLKEIIFTDINGVDLIVQYRKSAVFFMKRYEDEDLKEHPRGGIYIDGKGLKNDYEFTSDQFKKLLDSLKEISNECWTDFKPIEADSMKADYDDYYDRDFDNNGCLRIRERGISIEGAYTQPPNKNNLTRLIKFNKRTFASFIYDLEKRI